MTFRPTHRHCGERETAGQAGRLVVMSSRFANQVIAQIELFTNPEKYPIGVYVLPRHLDEKVARLQLKVNARLTELSDAQARHIGVDKAGPYKPDHYRY